MLIMCLSSITSLFFKIWGGGGGGGGGGKPLNQKVIRTPDLFTCIQLVKLINMTTNELHTLSA